MVEHEKPIAIWFFIGLLLTIYGVLILVSGLYDLMAGVRRDTVLANLHVGIWWGALLTVIGLIYTYLFSPNKDKR